MEFIEVDFCLNNTLHFSFLALKARLCEDRIEGAKILKYMLGVLQRNFKPENRRNFIDEWL
jgi:hypothetical protein